VTTRPVLLGGYASKSCPRVTHNTYDQTIAEPPSETSPQLQQLFDLGNTHEEHIFGLWLTTGRDVVDLRGLDEDKQAHIAATVAAMSAGRAVIIGGRLPDDLAGGRTGKPDALLRASAGGYHPCDVKAHKVLDKHTSDGLVSSISEPGFDSAAPHEFGLRYDERDLLQLAHYWRMLQACGYQAAEPRGSIIGTDTPPLPSLAWYHLDEPLFRTFSRRLGKTQRSSLDRYDHEHDFRVRVARVAQARTGAADDPEPLVVPVGQPECLACAWAPVCVDTLPGDDLSARLPAGKLSVREYLTLREQGINSLDDLADANLEQLLSTPYAQENGHLRGLATRLRKARTSAELTRLDLEVRMRPGAAFAVPRAEVEIDLDVEWDRSNRVYLWGALVTTRGTSEFVPFLDATATDDASERTLAQRCLDWIASTHPDALVYHYSPAEQSQARRILGPDVSRYTGTSADPSRWIDLHPFVRDGFDAREGLGLKTIATAGAGFAWRDEDPGGLQSQEWLDAARGGDASAERRIVDYNEDDVRATLALRNWLDGLDGASGPR
jgi:predicted RecB family nuclease